MTSVPLSQFPRDMQALAMPYPVDEAPPSTPSPWTAMHRVFATTFGLSCMFAFIDQSSGAGLALVITAVCSGLGLIITRVGAVVVEMRKLDRIERKVDQHGQDIAELKEGRDNAR